MKCTQKPQWITNGVVNLPLCCVLQILGWKVEYEEDRFEFYSAKTNHLMFEVLRSNTYQSVWDILHDSGVFENPAFIRLAEEKIKRK